MKDLKGFKEFIEANKETDKLDMQAWYMWAEDLARRNNENDIILNSIKEYQQYIIVTNLTHK